MSQVTVSIPEEALEGLKLPPQEAADEVRLAAAIKLYEVGRLSSGAAAARAGLPRALSLEKIADYGVTTFRLTEAELREDLARA